MFQLFETTRLLSLPSARRHDGVRASVVLSTFAENADWQILVLVCSSGHVVLYLRHLHDSRPRFWSLPWSTPRRPHPFGDVVALCTDPFGTKVVLATAGSALLVWNIVPFLDENTCSSNRNVVDDAQSIRLSRDRGMPTCVCWWQTLKGVPVAVVGTELGELRFVDLQGRGQLASTAIGHAIVDVHVVSAVRNITHLLVTDVDRQHWHLLLEDKGSGHDWLRIGHSPVATTVGAAATGAATSEWRLWSSADREDSPAGQDKSPPQQPRRVSKLGRDTLVDKQTVQGRQCLLVLDAASGQLELYDGGDVARRASCLYSVPVTGARHVVLTDQLLIVAAAGETGSPDTQLHLFSKSALDFSSITTKKKECIDPTLQRFVIKEPALAIYRCSRPCHQLQTVATAGTDAASEDFKGTDEVPLTSETFLDGCLVVTRYGVYACKSKCSAERLFLGFTGSPSTLPLAEHLGALLNLDMFSLYEAAAEAQLVRGQFPQAVRLYQLSKCPQLKRVAHFASRGFLSELLAYVQVLFGTRASEIPVPDRVHFANVAALGFVQQVLSKRHGTADRDAVLQAFREFLRENLYYDASVVMRMLSEQRLYELLYHCAQLRGQRRLMVEQLAHFDPSLALDSATCATLASRGYGHLLQQATHEYFPVCVTDPDLLLPLSCDLSLLGTHLRLLADLLPRLDPDLVQRVARMYDASRPGPALALRRVLLASSRQGRYPGSSSSLSTDSLDLTQSDDDTVNEEDIVKFMIFVLLMLNRRRSKNRGYDEQLLKTGFFTPSAPSSLKRTAAQDSERYVASGQSHCGLVVRGKAYTWGRAQFGRLGHRESHKEILGVTCVEVLDNLRVKVSQVACGTHHTLFNTDAGVFSCGSSRYGQLGLGDLQRTWVPHLVDTLAGREVIKVAAGLYHSLAVTKDGSLFTWGWGVHGQLGHGGCADERQPREVASLVDHKVVDAYGGCGHSVALTSEGVVFTFGCNLFGQLGLGRSPKRSSPQRVDLGEPVRLLCSGFFQVLALLSSGRLLTWGANPQSLRLQAQSSRRSRLQAVVAQNELLSSLAGGPHGGNLRHPVSAAATGALPTAGTSPVAQALLHGHQRHLSPTEVDLSAVRGPLVGMACGSNHALLLTRDGEIFAWGRNTEGQLGLGNRKDQKSPQLVSHLSQRSKVVQVSCGRDFSLALDTQGKLWAWGQNDGGQLACKVPTEESSVRHLRVLSSRLITIRTSRCLITIPQGQRTGEVRPIEVTALPPEMTRPPPEDLEQSLRQKAFQNAYLSRSTPTFDLGSLDDPPYGPVALHTALEAFRGSYDPTSVVNYCQRFSDFQAAAKVSLLEGQFAQALQYQFQALMFDPRVTREFLTTNAVEAVTYYLGLIDKENSEANFGFFENMVSFWQEEELPVKPLEKLFQSHLPDIGYSLGLVLFSNEREVVSQFVSRLSTGLCLSLAAAMRERVTSGHPHGELIGVLLEKSGTAALAAQIRLVDESAGWEPAVPPQRLWEQLVRSLGHGIRRKAALRLSAPEVARLTQTLLAEQAAKASSSPTDKLVGNALVFSCGHNTTATAFHETAMPELEDSLLRRLQRPLPLTAKLLARGYAMPGVIPFACPRCVVNEIRANW
ncbi:uncharacterized protein LOC142592614 [Dermacentor variabilis]|uniref:uncharacterized protein LOC142592614 n=1 Tax=Dermacentor variabilis TaxID=34621 RepID=UPI003F5B0823